MNIQLTRRTLLALGCGATVAACTSGQRRPKDQGSPAQEFERQVAALEGTVGGRVGLYALDTGTGRSLAHRAHERFALCSTFKWVLAAAVLARVDQGQLRLDQPVSYSTADMVAHAPVTALHVEHGSLSLEELMSAAVVVSDNPAANLLLKEIGGPAGLTQFVRALGDEVTRLDRNEPSLNTNAPGDVRDTTSPHAMVQLMKAVLLGDALSRASREQLVNWLRAVETGKHRLASGLPAHFDTGDKTGTGERGAVNDVALSVPPGRAPWLLAVYLSDSTSDLTVLEGAHAALANLIAQQWA